MGLPYFQRRAASSDAGSENESRVFCFWIQVPIFLHECRSGRCERQKLYFQQYDSWNYASGMHEPVVSVLYNPPNGKESPFHRISRKVGEPLATAQIPLWTEQESPL